MSFKDDNSLNSLIQAAGQKTGIDPNRLKENVQSGKLDELVAKMNPADREKFNAILANPDLAQQMLQSKQAQMLIKQFMK